MQPFILGGDAVQVLAMHASPGLHSAISIAFCDQQLTPDYVDSLPGGSALEEAHLSVLLSDLDPAIARQHYDFLVRATP